MVPRLVGITGALLQASVGDFVVDVLLEHVLVRELYVPVEMLQLGRLVAGSRPNHQPIAILIFVSERTNKRHHHRGQWRTCATRDEPCLGPLFLTQSGMSNSR